MSQNDLINSKEFQTLIKSLVKEAISQYLEENEKLPTCNYLTRLQIAKVLRVSLPTINNWVDRKILNPRHLGDKRFFYFPEVIATLEANRKYK